MKLRSMRVFCLIGLFFFPVLLLPVDHASALVEAYYVSTTGDKTNTGLSKAQAFPSIDYAMWYSIYVSRAKQIIVLPGMHVGPENRSLDTEGFPIIIRSLNPSSPACVASTVVNMQGNGRAIGFHRHEDDRFVLDGLTFINGNSNRGGAIHIYTGSDPVIRRCVFRNNYASDSGGAISCDEYSEPLIEDCIFEENTAMYGGALNINDHSAPRVRRCTIRNNRALHSRGAISCHNNSSPLIENCIIQGNTADEHGGGIYCDWSSPTVRTCLITDNASPGDGGGFTALWNSFPVVEGCTIACNRAGNGQQLFVGGGSRISMNSSIVWGSGIKQVRAQPSEVQAKFSDIVGGWEGEGNIAEIPRFRGQDGPDDNQQTYEDNDYHLLPASPCVNGGDPALGSMGDDDIDGRMRVFEGRIDMGCDELSTAAEKPAEAKAAEDGDIVHIRNALVSLVMNESFYIQADDRSSGIRVDYPAHGIVLPARVNVSGISGTDADGEKYINAESVEVQQSADSPEPLWLANKWLGGGDTPGYDANTGAGQRGVAGGLGLNNVGLFVATSGRVVSVQQEGEESVVRLTDGSTTEPIVAIGRMPDALPVVDEHIQIHGVVGLLKNSHDTPVAVIRWMK